MKKPVALVCNSYQSALKYLIEKYKESPRKMYNGGRLIEFHDGTQVAVITSLGEVQGREFSEYWIHPEYEDELVASVRARVR